MADKIPNDGENVISMKTARERAARKAEPPKPKPKPKFPAFLIFLGLLAILVGYRYLTGGLQ